MKQFNLREERKEFKSMVLMPKNKKELDFILDEIEKLDKEFIKKLKESINSESLYSPMAKDWIIKEIDKLI